MKRRLPPLHALRVFEVAARHLSFSKAADELCVTNAAISHQVRLLEDELGLRLFNRRHNRLELTEAGENYAPRVRESMRALQEATESILGRETRLLRIGVTPVFAAKWLVPRLYRFLNQNAEYRIDLATEPEPDPRAHDLCIDDRRTAIVGYQSERFATTCFVPVGVPRLGPQIRACADLPAQRLLHVRAVRGLAHHPTWQRWFDEVGLNEIDSDRGITFSDESLAFQAAIDGEGIMLGQRLLVAYDVAAGRLAELLPTQTSSTLSYYMIFAQDTVANPGLAALRRWLIAEAREIEDPRAGA